MAKEMPPAPPTRASGVAQVSRAAAPSAAGRSASAPFVVSITLLLALGVAGGIWFGGRIGRDVVDNFSVIFDAWRNQDKSVGQLQVRVQAVQQQLVEWAALEPNADGRADTTGVLVIDRQQVMEMANQLGTVATEMESLRRVISQRESIVGQSSEALRRNTTASLWAVIIGMFAAAALAGVWLWRAAARPVMRLRHALEVADQGQQALATALGPWFEKIAAAISDRRSQAEAQVAAGQRMAGRLEVLGQLAHSLGERARQMAESSNRFERVAERVRDFGDESKVLALSAAIEGARMEAQGRGVAVVAEELRRVAVEARETVSEMLEIRDALRVGADQSTRASGRLTEEASAVRRETVDAYEGASRFVVSLSELEARVRAAAQAAGSSGARVMAGRSSRDLRAVIDRALAPEGTAPVDASRGGDRPEPPPPPRQASPATPAPEHPEPVAASAAPASQAEAAASREDEPKGQRAS